MALSDQGICKQNNGGNNNNINNRNQNQNRKLNNGTLVHVQCMSVGVLLKAGTQ
jgi:hypothetical protein